MLFRHSNHAQRQGKTVEAFFRLYFVDDEADVVDNGSQNMHRLIEATERCRKMQIYIHIHRINWQTPFLSKYSLFRDRATE